MFYFVLGIVIILVGFCVYRYLQQIFICLHLDLQNRKVQVFHWLLTLAAAGICMNPMRVPALAILYTLLFAGILHLLFWILRIIRRKWKKRDEKIVNLQRKSCLLPVVMAIVLLGFGVVNMNRIHETVYEITTEKLKGTYEIALVTDTHYGTVQDTKLLEKEMAALSARRPDVLILDGDIVEEGTSRAQMEDVFRIFGNVDTKYGVYYVYGNHDLQNYANKKAYSRQELEQVLAENEITLLADSFVQIDDTLVLVGRDDAGYGLPGERKTMEAILQGVSRAQYIIAADHQPVDVGECASAGVDLMLSGHTHAGQIWPLGLFLKASGSYNYGLYDGETCKVIVSSGFTGWGYPMRTEGKCEYVLIRLEGEKAGKN
ncbi:metallophosphoesterase [Ihubacter sp. mB4P-1]|uniref:metallophosphoesterase n=1 Tax=Ihubacter sp. mB4P-1 TaxID=3242370 RepID=UPI003C79B991